MISINEHSSIKIENESFGTFYFDPYGLKGKFCDADIIFITHDHYDHFSPEDVKKAAGRSTKYVCPSTCLNSLISEGIPEEMIIHLNPDENCTLEVRNGQSVNVNAVHAYNIIKPFHPKRKNWLGYKVEIDGTSYYIPGDMDENEDALKVKCDVLFVPIGGTYTMNAAKGAAFTNKIKPKIAIPMHYGSVVGPNVKGEDFAMLVDKETEVKIFI